MKVLGIGIVTCTLLLTSGIAQNAPARATLQDVKVTLAGQAVRVEIVLSTPVSPVTETATHPSRILLDFHGIEPAQNDRRIDVGKNGIRSIRIARHSANPLVTRLVIDLDQSHSFSVKAEGNRVILLVDAAAARNSGAGAPAAAMSGTLSGIFHRRQGNRSIAAGDASTPPGNPLPAPGMQAPDNASGTATQTSPIPVQQATGTASPDSGTSIANAPGQQTFDQRQIATAVAPSSPRAGMTKPSPSDAMGAVFQTAPNTPSVTSPSVASSSSPIAGVSTIAHNAQPEGEPTSSSSSAQSNHAATMIARSDDPNLKTVFKVKYVAEGAVYLEGGRAQGLAEGMKLEILETDTPARQGESANAADPHVVAELDVIGVAETSAVTDIHSAKRPVKVGDLAYLSNADADALVQQRTLSATRQYPAVVSFTQDDTLDEEARQEVPRPPLPSVNRARGEIGMDYMDTIGHGSSVVSSSETGVVFRGDITRIGGTYWNLSGYWRGRLTSSSAQSQPTLQDLINRTYHINMTYDNPNSDIVAGFGRLYLPWAPSLDTLDGGYLGDRVAKGTIIGMFAGSTPDPSSWDYSPSNRMGGLFVNFEGGAYDTLHYTFTTGAGVNMSNWAITRPFLFIEDSVSYRRTIALYESAQFDNPVGNGVARTPGMGLGRNFSTIRINPVPRLELDANYNYFRDIPTFDPTLVGTGLLDKYLFQGFSAGGRLELLKGIFVSSTLGKSSGTGDSKSSWNEMYGVTFGRLPVMRLRADVHYARFNSSFGTGFYESISLSRQMSDTFRLEVLGGKQNFNSPLTVNNSAVFVTGTVETTIGPHYYLQGNFTNNRGPFSYNQFMISMGYRFDSRSRHKE